MILPETPFYNIPGWVHALNQGVDRIALFPATSIVYPCPAACGTDKERMVVLNRQIIDRVAAKTTARPRRKLLGLVLLPRQVRHLQRRTRPRHDARPDPKLTR